MINRTIARDIIRGGFALLTLIALVFGTPLLLWSWMGSPIPSGSDFDALRSAAGTGVVDDETFFRALAWIAWLLWAVVVVSIVTRRFGQFAFVRPGREMLWSGLDKETKYKAKNFVDVPVYRAADALFAQLDNGIHAVGGAQAVAIVGAVAAAVWAVNGLWLGRQHDATAVPERAAVP